MQVKIPPHSPGGRTGRFPIDQLYLGDSLSLMADLPDGAIDLIITDPPFAIDFRATRNNYNRTGSRVMQGYREIAPEDYLAFTTDWMGQAFRVLRPTGSLYVFSGWNRLRDVLQALDETGFTTINHLIWKYQFGVFTKKRYVTSHYHILFAAKDPKKLYLQQGGALPRGRLGREPGVLDREAEDPHQAPPGAREEDPQVLVQPG